MALNIKPLEGPKHPYDVEDVSMANAVVRAPTKTEGADLNMAEQDLRDADKRASKEKELKNRKLWYRKLWVLSRP